MANKRNVLYVRLTEEEMEVLDFIVEETGINKTNLIRRFIKSYYVELTK